MATNLTARIDANIARMGETKPSTKLRKNSRCTGRFTFIGNQPVGRCTGTWRHYVFIRPMDAELAADYCSHKGDWHNLNNNAFTFGGFTLAAI